MRYSNFQHPDALRIDGLAKKYRPPKCRKPPRRQRRTSRAALIRKLDALVGAEVRSRGACEVLGGSTPHGGPLQCAHGLSRRYLGTRFDLQNLFALCKNHHCYYTYHPQEWEFWLGEKLGAGPYRSLQVKAFGIAKVTPAELEARIAEFSAKGGL